MEPLAGAGIWAKNIILISFSPGFLFFRQVLGVAPASGRLAQTIRELAANRSWAWTVDLAFNPDAELIRSDRIVISSDGPLLDRVQRWGDLTGLIIEKRVADVWLIDLS